MTAAWSPPTWRRDKRQLTDADYDRLADVAETGFDPADLKPRRSRSSPGGQSGASPRVAVRLAPHVHAQVLARAAAEGRTLSDVLSDLVEAYAAGDPVVNR